MNFLRWLLPSYEGREELSVGLVPIPQASHYPYSRESGRVPVRYRVTILCEHPSRGLISVPAQVLDVTGSGALIEASKPMEIGSLVYARGKDMTFLAGSAYVQHCTRRVWKYRIGLKFRTPLGHRF
jgi:hypothetical protein